MNDFSSKCVETASAPPDPRKHVNYVQGMVLGADDLQQEFAYHQHQNHWLARDTIGYGTLSGLLVEKNGTQIAVTPGAALSPRGQLIRVVPRQCASLDAWLRLADTQQRLQERGVGLNDAFTAYVVLCFRDCPTDPLPVPGEPCRCDSEATSPSRITDDFRLELRLDPPAQREEDAVRDFVAWLRRIRTTGADSGYATVAEFLDALRTAARDLASPLESPPDFMYGSPPENLVLPDCHLCEYLRAALHLWVTELRPVWQARWTTKIGGGCGCHGAEQTDSHSSEPCLLLARLKVTLSLGNATEGGIEVDDRQRPLVVHLRMLQELLLCGRAAACCNGRTFATLFILDAETLRLWVHHPAPVNFDESALSLEVNGRPLAGFSVAHVDTSTEPDTTFEHNVFDVFLGASPPVPLQGGQRIVARFDTRLIVENSSPALTLADSLRQGCVCYPDLADDVVTVFSVGLQSADNLILDGDATGPVHQNTVEKVKNIPVDLTSAAVPPGSNPVLGFDGATLRLIQHPAVPPIPQASDDPPKPVGFGLGQVHGTDPNFSRADHVHGFVDPVPPHVARTRDHDNHEIHNDVEGTLANTKVTALQNVPVSGTKLTSAQNGFVLTFRTPGGPDPGKWKAEMVPQTQTLQGNTGLVTFPPIGEGELHVTPPLKHGVPLTDPKDPKKIIYQVCIRLGLEFGGIAYTEDTDVLFRTLPSPISAPFVMARWDPAKPEEFRIILRDVRTEDKTPVIWEVRWYAFAVQPFEDSPLKPEDTASRLPQPVPRIRRPA